MRKTKPAFAAILFPALILSAGVLGAAEAPQSVTLANTVHIPGADLKPGTYNFSVEDRLPDRAIVRVANASDAGEHYLVMAVPNPKIASGGSDGLAYFKGSQTALKAWSCASCPAPLEFVYPKLEAVKITDASTEPVLAIDPTYDKLPDNLTADDMKVVTLWLLAPERVTPDNVGQGVKAAKYSPSALDSATAAAPAAAAAAPAPAPAAVTAPAATAPATDSTAGAQQTAAEDKPAAAAHRARLPKTASNNFTLAVCGLVCLAGAYALRLRRRASQA